MLLVIRCFA